METWCNRQYIYSVRWVGHDNSSIAAGRQRNYSRSYSRKLSLSETGSEKQCLPGKPLGRCGSRRWAVCEVHGCSVQVMNYKWNHHASWPWCRAMELEPRRWTGLLGRSVSQWVLTRIRPLKGGGGNLKPILAAKWGSSSWPIVQAANMRIGLGLKSKVSCPSLQILLCWDDGISCTDSTLFLCF